MRVVHQNLLLPYGGDIEEDSGDEESWQEADDPQDSNLVDSDSKEFENDVVSIDSKPIGEVEAIHVQHIQIEGKLDYWTQSTWGWLTSLYVHQ